MAVPKRRTSKSRIRTRRRIHERKMGVPAVVSCPECGAPRQPHRVCPSCGYYRGRQVLTVQAE